MGRRRNMTDVFKFLNSIIRRNLNIFYESDGIGFIVFLIILFGVYATINFISCEAFLIFECS